MTNETTASQPNSIGDDARYVGLLHNVKHSTDEIAARTLLSGYIDSMLNFRAPAAQASATIQAAPEVGRTLAWLIDPGAGSACDKVTRTMPDDALRADVARRHGSITELVARPAATIQEPVIVAEPVGEAKPYSCETGQIDEALANFLAEHTRLNQDGIDTHAMTMTLALNYAAINPTPESDIAEWREQGYLPDAAPMVADPAGVILSKLPVHYVEGLENGGYYLCTDVIRALAATIQEPVMVAEPVAEVVEGATVGMGIPTRDIKFIGASAKVGDKLYLAAPMVADPAGAYQALLDVRYAIQFSHDSVGGIDKMPVMMHHDGTVVEFIDAVLSGAATVKAVPSEALDNRDAVIAECISACEAEKVEAEITDEPTDHSYNLAIKHCVITLTGMKSAAPLADKTGGGE